jgi:Asp/Glu/hydantoin racemase
MMSTVSKKLLQKPSFGIIMLDTVFQRILGDVGNPETFMFPVIYEKVVGATPEKLIIDADPGLIKPFIAAGKELIKQGAKAISTSCGFLALFHQELVHALDVPVFTSSLLQVHLAHAFLRKDQKVGIITARKQSLTREHLSAIGISHYPLAIIGMEEAGEFTKVFIKGEAPLDKELCQKEMEHKAMQLKKLHPEIGAIVLECTNMPPYSKAIHNLTGLPVFDAVTMIKHAYLTLHT